MILRRVREHVSQHNWFAVAIDLAIVVAGVFLGTQANNWNEARIERAVAAELRREIIDDLRTNEIDMAARKAFYKTVRDYALSAMGALERSGDLRGAPFLVDAYQASKVWLRPVTRSGYDEMTGAGLSHSIGDRQTRSRLIAYYTQIRQFDVTALNATSYRERLRRAMPYKVQAAVMQRCGQRVSMLVGGTQSAVLPVSCKLDFDQPTINIALARVEGADLVEDLTRHIADLDQKLSGFDTFAQQANGLRLHLEKQEGR